MTQYARVPTELIELVDAHALQMYAALCRYADHKTHVTHVLNPTLSRATGQSLARVGRSLRQLEDAGVIERKGRQQRRLRIVPLEALSLSAERKSGESFDLHGASFHSPQSDLTRGLYPDSTSPLRVDVRDESEAHVNAAAEEPMFEVERVERERPTTQACVAAFVDAYEGSLSREVIARLGKEFKRLSATYSRDELVAIASELGTARVANPRAIEAWLLRARQPRHQEQVNQSRWSEIGATAWRGYYSGA